MTLHIPRNHRLASRRCFCSVGQRGRKEALPHRARSFFPGAPSLRWQWGQQVAMGLLGDATLCASISGAAWRGRQWKTLRNVLFKDTYSDSCITSRLHFSQYLFFTFALTSNGTSAKAVSAETRPTIGHVMGYRQPQRLPNLSLYASFPITWV